MGENFSLSTLQTYCEIKSINNHNKRAQKHTAILTKRTSSVMIPVSTTNINQGTPTTRARVVRVVSPERESEPEEEEEEQEEEPEDDDAPIAFDPADYKLYSSTAIKKLELTLFPRLSSPSNYIEYYKKFQDAIIVSQLHADSIRT